MNNILKKLILLMINRNKRNNKFKYTIRNLKIIKFQRGYQLIIIWKKTKKMNLRIQDFSSPS
jgi:hypothetical protein